MKREMTNIKGKNVQFSMFNFLFHFLIFLITKYKKKAVWGEGAKVDKQAAMQYEIQYRIDQTRQQYTDFLSKLSATLIEVQLLKERPEVYICVLCLCE